MDNVTEAVVLVTGFGVTVLVLTTVGTWYSLKLMDGLFEARKKEAVDLTAKTVVWGTVVGVTIALWWATFGLVVKLGDLADLYMRLFD